MAIKLYYNKTTYQFITLDDGGESIVVGDDGGKEFHFYFGTGTSLVDYVNDATIPVDYLGRVVIERPDGDVSNELYLTPVVADGYFKLIVSDWISQIEGNLEFTTRLKVSDGAGGYTVYPFTMATIPVEAGVTPGDDTIEDAQYQAIMDAVDGVIAGTTDIVYDNTGSDIVSTDVESAIKEVNDKANANEQDILNLQNEKEDVANKATVWGTPDDTKYPTTKLVDDRLDPVETFKGSAESRLQIIESDIDNLEDGTTVIPTYELKANKATDFSTVDDNKYPTVEAVKEQLDLKESLANKGQPNGYVGLNGSTLIDSVYLPSYVDDVIEVATYANLPATGETGKLYIVVADETSSNKHSTYRWTGTVYVKIHDEMSAAEIKSLYESNANTNAYTDAEKTKLAGLEDGANYYDKDYIDALADLNGWQATLLTPTPMVTTDSILTATLQAYDKLLFVARNTATGELDSDEITGSMIVSGNKLVFFDTVGTYLLVGETNTTFTTGTTHELIIYGYVITQQEAENIAYDNTDSELVATNVQDAIDELEDEIDAVGARIDTAESDIDDLEQKDVIHDSRISTIEEQLRKSTSGENTATKSGTENISLGSDVANAPINVLVEGGLLDAPQLVTNGDFSDGTTEWNTTSASISVTDGILTYVGNGTTVAPRISNALTLIPAIKYYIIIKYKVDNSDVLTIRYFNNTATVLRSSPTINTWYEDSVVFTKTGENASFTIYHYYIDSQTANGKSMLIDYAYTFNISTLIANKTYSPLYNKTFDLMSDAEIKAQMDLWVQNGTLPNDNVLAVGMNKRVRSVGKNLFDKVSNKLVIGRVSSTTGAVTLGQNGHATPNLIRIKPNTQYSILSQNTFAFITFYDIDGIFISQNSSGTPFTTPINAYYVRLSRHIGTVPTNEQNELENNALQLELGSTATSYVPYANTDLYLQANKVGYKLPNGVADTVEYRNGKYYYVQRVKKYVLQASDIYTYYTLNVNFDIVGYTKQIDYTLYGTSTTGISPSGSILFPNFVSGVYEESPSAIGRIYNNNSTTMGLTVAKGTYASLAQAQTALAGTVIYYQLATPVETEILTIGNAQVGPNSSIYIDDIKWATDIYTTNITVATAISELVSITKMNTDGSETQLAVSGATISGDGLSFTHSGLASGDAVRFTYIPRGDYFKGNTDVIYYNNPLIVVDSVTSTVYKIIFTIANGVITVGKVAV